MARAPSPISSTWKRGITPQILLAASLSIADYCISAIQGLILGRWRVFFMPQRFYLRRLALLSAAVTATLYFGTTAPPARAQTTTIAVTGSAAPGLPAGAKFSTFGVPQLNNAGQIGFLGTLQTGLGGVTSANDTALFAGAPAALQLAAREGSAASGAGAGAVFTSFGEMRFNGLAQLAFTGSLLVGTGGVTSSNDHGIWAGGAGAVQLVAREGSAAPGVSGATF